MASVLFTVDWLFCMHVHACAFSISCGSQPMVKRWPAQLRILAPLKDTLCVVFHGHFCAFVCAQEALNRNWSRAGACKDSQGGWGSRTSYSRDCLRPLTGGRGGPQPGRMHASHLDEHSVCVGNRSSAFLLGGSGDTEQQQQHHISQVTSSAAISTGIIK